MEKSNIVCASRTIRFNTGRKYTQFGQRITATLHADGYVTFYDTDRMIDGGFELRPEAPFNQTEVMLHYDQNAYRSTQRSWSDGLMRDGINRWQD